MPEMDGLTCLSRIMVQRPKPVVMVSSLTEQARRRHSRLSGLARSTSSTSRTAPFRAISSDQACELLLKVRSAATTTDSTVARAGCSDRRTARRPPTRIEPALPPLPRDKLGIVLVGVSTGGPGTLEDILPHLHAGFPWPVVIAQHMPASFTGVFARRLGPLLPRAGDGSDAADRARGRPRLYRAGRCGHRVHQDWSGHDGAAGASQRAASVAPKRDANGRKRDEGACRPID